MDEQDLYKEIILDHYHHPRKSGKLAAYTHSSHIDNPLCGDTIDTYLRVTDGVVVDASFIASGCAISIASASILFESLLGKTIAQIQRITTEDILASLHTHQLTPARLKCALLPLEAVHRALIIKK
ncbi:Fe-S cluster protein [Candidatus Roizmanbacteria bacterium CG10_big_fil_rev_8_21_14_0_10_45_7]|uniref:Fe-S cluster protein n=1 Tax=Candidatus Roizmanbacteria bacterium CG10_big_fil_rev_8_21_14_0_10_45_7 TaxID=1974854 RepID=A0A2M8KVN5_9BACT|nr:MAG: Fe-S cluster protein [Candidatus Roizmanbacteria bacterium CG10_big_fil_rev_8_21_14_0_10_45_7]